MTHSALSFRPAREADLERLIEIHATAFPDSRGSDARRSNFLANRLGALSDLHVAEKNGGVVGHAFLLPLTAWFGGIRVKTGGIASVAVAPEARGSGVGTGLLAHLHELSHARGDALTMLYAFRQGFYSRQGYAPVAPSKRLTASPRAIPRAWGEAGSVRAAEGADRAEIVRIYDAVASRRTGLFVRSERFWDGHFAHEKRHFFVLKSLRGYVAFRLAQSEPHAMTRLIVDELLAEDDASMRLLFGLLGAQRDHVAEVEVDVDEEDSIDRALVDADGGRYGTQGSTLSVCPCFP